MTSRSPCGTHKRTDKCPSFMNTRMDNSLVSAIVFLIEGVNGGTDWFSPYCPDWFSSYLPDWFSHAFSDLFGSHPDWFSSCCLDRFSSSFWSIQVITWWLIRLMPYWLMQFITSWLFNSFVLTNPFDWFSWGRPDWFRSVELSRRYCQNPPTQF